MRLAEEAPEREPLYDRAARAVGRFRDRRGARDLAAGHDRYLDEAYELSATARASRSYPSYHQGIVVPKGQVLHHLFVGEARQLLVAQAAGLDHGRRVAGEQAHVGQSVGYT